MYTVVIHDDWGVGFKSGPPKLQLYIYGVLLLLFFFITANIIGI